MNTQLNGINSEYAAEVPCLHTPPHPASLILTSRGRRWQSSAGQKETLLVPKDKLHNIKHICTHMTPLNIFTICQDIKFVTISTAQPPRLSYLIMLFQSTTVFVQVNGKLTTQFYSERKTGPTFLTTRGEASM